MWEERAGDGWTALILVEPPNSPPPSQPVWENVSHLALPPSWPVREDETPAPSKPSHPPPVTLPSSQFKPITVVRFVIGGTIEERILKLQV